MRKLSFLVTNDDGIESPFLAALVNALEPVARLVVVAPSAERSWIGKAISRRAQVAVRRREDLFRHPAWSVDGTPADCVNIGLAHLATDGIDAVVSGINIGSNASLPLILASGTVGAALEGALHGHHAIASSIRLEPADFAAITQRPGTPLSAHLEISLRSAAERTVEICRKVARRPPLLRTLPALMSAGRLFTPVDGSDGGTYSFSFSTGGERPSTGLTDRACIESGRGSHTILDFSRIGVPRGVERVPLPVKAFASEGI